MAGDLEKEEKGRGLRREGKGRLLCSGRILYSGLLGESSHLFSRDFTAFLRGSANGGRAKKCEQEKTVREEKEGLQEVPSSLLLFFFLRSSFRFTLHYLNAWNKQEISRVSLCLLRVRWGGGFPCQRARGGGRQPPHGEI